MKKNTFILLASLYVSSAYSYDVMTGNYVEGAVGKANFENFCLPFNASACDESTTSFRLAAGISLAKAISFDVGYIDFGEVSTNGVGYQLTGAVTAYSAQIGLQTEAAKTLLFAKLGGAYTQFKQTSHITCICINNANLASNTHSDFGPMMTFGIELPIFEKLSVVGQYDYLISTKNNATSLNTNLSVFSIGIRGRL